MRVHYNSALTEKARWLRNNMTLSEVLLWNKLKGKQLLGYDFDRQKPILNYIVDFCCFKLKLIIEIDGFSHDFKMDYDAERQKELELLGFLVLRFQDWEVKKDIENVVQRIVDVIENEKVIEDQPRIHTPRPSF